MSGGSEFAAPPLPEPLPLLGTMRFYNVNHPEGGFPSSGGAACQGVSRLEPLLVIFLCTITYRPPGGFCGLHPKPSKMVQKLTPKLSLEGPGRGLGSHLV